MRKVLPLVAALLLGILAPIFSKAQRVSVKGMVHNAVSGERISALSIVVKGTPEGTFTDEKGMFELVTDQETPFELEFSSIGYETKSVSISGSVSDLDVAMTPASALGQEVVISANRTPSRILESPVSIERIGNAAIHNSPAADYYDMIGNLKGVDIVSSSLTFKTPTTRGFAASGNSRFNQIVAGMDNQAPGLTFSVGSIVGLNELDVESMELLQGASSALYGPGGMNGTLIINAKNPFKYQGLSFQIKEGILDVVDPGLYHNINLRWAQKVGNRFAYKIGAELIHAQDWLGDDNRNYQRFGSDGKLVPGTRETDPNYDGINVYGDETTANLKDVLNAIADQAPFLKDFVDQMPSQIPVSRTGYKERNVVNPVTYNLKLSGAIHYKLTNSIEASLSGNFGTGNTVYTGISRFSLLKMKMGQYKVELNHKNWFLRAYTTQENAGESHNLTATTQLVNEVWKPSVGATGWYATYGQAYLANKLSGMKDINAHNAARAVADVGRPAPGSKEFKDIYNEVRKKPIPEGGLLLDRSDLWMIEGQYNLTEAVKFVEVLVGGNYKQYVLNSEGTLFADKKGDPIRINEYGGYIQVAKSLLNDVLRLTASGRYDKHDYFKSRFTPRLTGVIKVAKDNNVRLSYQTAYRFPTNQQQWIDLFTGTGRLIGGVKQLWDKYDLTNNPGYTAESIKEGSPQVLPYKAPKPETVRSYELGYKAIWAKRILIDAYGYFSEYHDFISRRDIAQQKDPQKGFELDNLVGYSMVFNAPGKVNAYGWGLSIDYVLPVNFRLSGNISSDVLSDVPKGFRADFNAPRYRTNITLANTAFGEGKKFSASATWRWQDAFFFESDFAIGPLPSISTVDAQFSYRMAKSLYRVGATNLFNQKYRNGLGNATIGGLYYVSYGYNIF